MIGLEHYLTVAAALFVIGIFGLFLNRKNVIILLMSIELMLLAVSPPPRPRLALRSLSVSSATVGPLMLKTSM